LKHAVEGLAPRAKQEKIILLCAQREGGELSAFDELAPPSYTYRRDGRLVPTNRRRWWMIFEPFCYCPEGFPLKISEGPDLTLAWRSLVLELPHNLFLMFQ
jgi:hypothetical protein